MSKKVEYKVTTTYDLLMRNLQIMDKNYRFKILPVMVGALLLSLMPSKKVKVYFINKVLRKMQNNSVRGTMTICKTFMKCSES